jgi:predicted anti-sigma-YlaC factor YlaD
MPESPERITCQEVTELVTEYLEGTRGAHEPALFEQHLNFCDGCDWYVDQMRTTITAVGRIEEADVPADMRDRLLAAFRDRRRS